MAYLGGSINLKLFHRLSNKDFLEDFTVNVMGAVNTIQACLPGMKKAGNAAVVLLSTVAVQRGLTFHASVSAAATPPLPTDCLGHALNKIKAEIPGIPAGYGSDVFSAELNDMFYFVADNRFYIDSSSATAAPSLYCQGNGIDSTAQPLVENIEDMQITYGVEIPSNQTRTVAGYLRADELLAQPDPDVLAAFTPHERWRKVVTVRICLLVRSEDAVVSDPASARYVNCAGTLENAPSDDLRLRRTYSTTVILRNWLEIAGATSS